MKTLRLYPAFLVIWHGRRTGSRIVRRRNRLDVLSNHLMRDIGVTRETV
jgi:uncharacterized protein YjiS (DUF1127 family)